MENKLTNEQIEKAKTLSEKEHMELTDERLKAIAGGNIIFNPTPARTGLSDTANGSAGGGAANGHNKGK